MRIRPLCVIVMLTWGLTYGAGGAGAQGYPNFTPNGYPPGFAPVPMPYSYPNPGFYAPPPGAMSNGYFPMQTAQPQPGLGGFATYPGSQLPAVPSAPVGLSSAGNGLAPALDGGNTEVLKNLPTPTTQAPSAAPAPAVGEPSTPVPQATPVAPAGPGEPMISYLPNGFLQPFNDSATPAPVIVPTRVSPDRAWATFDYLIGFSRPERLPAPLVTTGSAFDAAPGALGQPGTSVAYGGPINFGMQSGFRINVGSYIDTSCRFSIEADGMDYFPSHQSFGIHSDGSGNPLITRPIYNVLTGSEAAYISSQPAAGGLGPVLGGTAVDSQTNLYGFEVNGRYNFVIAPRWRGDFLIGFRNLHLTEYLNISDNLTPESAGTLTFLGAGVPAGGQLSDIDSFRTRDSFYGLQIGGRLRFDYDWFFVTTWSKLAVGPNQQTVNISGLSTLSDAAGVTTAQGGVLALPSNSGTFRQTVFSVVPEFGLNFGINVTPNIQLTAGYSFLLWSNVVRPGGQVPHAVNPAQVPSDVSFGAVAGTVAPTFQFNSETFWIQNIMLGVNFHF